MRLYKKATLRGSSINITPLIDVILLLIIFFMTVSHIVQTEIDPLDLPETSEADEIEKEQQKRVIINIHEDGRIFVFGQDSSIAQVHQLLLEEKQQKSVEEIRVLIRADRMAQWDTIKEVLALCRRENLHRIRVAVIQKLYPSG